MTDARNNTTLFDYDPVYFKVSKVTNPMGQEELYSYDGNERLQQKINKDGSAVNYTYYKVGWLKEITSASRFTRFVRDNDGLPTKIESTDATVNQVFDGHGRLEAASSSHVPGEVTYTYNARGLRSSMTYTTPKEVVFTVNYFYDERKLPVRMEANLAGHPIVWERFWDELGRPETDLISNGMRIERSFDAAGRLTYLSNDFGGNPISRFEYSHNPGGTISGITKTFTRPEQGNVGNTMNSTRTSPTTYFSR